MSPYFLTCNENVLYCSSPSISPGSLRFNIDDSVYTRQEYIDIVRAWERGMFTEEDEE